MDMGTEIRVIEVERVDRVMPELPAPTAEPRKEETEAPTPVS
jgi:hypothetical protein